MSLVTASTIEMNENSSVDGKGVHLRSKKISIFFSMSNSAALKSSGPDNPGIPSCITLHPTLDTPKFFTQKLIHVLFFLTPNPNSSACPPKPCHIVSGLWQYIMNRILLISSNISLNVHFPFSLLLKYRYAPRNLLSHISQPQARFLPILHTL